MKFQHTAVERLRVAAATFGAAVLSVSAAGASAGPSAPPAADSQVRPVSGAGLTAGRYPTRQAHLAALSLQRKRTFRAPSALARAPVSAHQEVRISSVIRDDARLARGDYCAHHPLAIGSISGEVTQGGTIVAYGSCFGKAAGAVKMLGPFPGGAISLTVQSWTEQTVTAKVPAITGVPDQQVKIELAAPGEHGQTNVSPAVPMLFVSQRQVANVSSMVQNLSCASGQHAKHPGYGTDGEGYQCDGLALVNWTIPSSVGQHVQLAPDSGADTWRVHMQPGWRFDHIEVTEQADVVIDPSIDATNVSWTSNWHTSTTSWWDYSAHTQGGTQRFLYDGSYIVTVYGSGPV